MAGADLWQLRPDLDLIPAESGHGAPALLVHDPVTGSFDRVEWPESDLLELLRRPVSLEGLEEGFRALSPLKPGREDIRTYLAELGKRGWLRGSLFWQAGYRAPRRRSWMVLLAGLLFIQLPLLRPAKFLKATAGVAGLLLNPAVIGLILLCGVFGAYLALPRWEDYWRDSLGHFSLGALPAFLVSLVLVKAAHEFAHAYAATWAGARVASMGIAFFFFMPLPFTDVTDAWRLSWPRRLRVASAGMIAELGIAALALLGWALSPPGAAAVALARLSSVAVASTLLLNLNPGPRFDGYYILVCLFRIENLRARGVEILRQALDRLFLGAPAPPAEPGVSRRRRFGVVIYAAYAVLYRFSLGLGLALMGYSFLPKAVGLPLAAAVAWLFVGKPFVAEATRLLGVVRHMRVTMRMVLSLVILAAILIWFVGSWPRRVHFPAVTRAVVEEAVRTQRQGETLAIAAQRGERVERGRLLAELASPFEEPQTRLAEWALAEAELSEEQAWRNEETRRETGWLAAETRRRRVELDALRQRQTYLAVRSPADGVLAVWDRNLRPGVAVSRGKVLGWVTDGPVSLLSCYAPMEVARKLEVGAAVRFVPDSGAAVYSGTIVGIGESRPEILQDNELAAQLGATPERDDTYLLSEPYARIEVRLDGDAGRVGQTGAVWTRTRPESLAAAAWRWLGSLAVRESAF